MANFECHPSREPMPGMGGRGLPARAQCAERTGCRRRRHGPRVAVLACPRLLQVCACITPRTRAASEFMVLHNLLYLDEALVLGDVDAKHSATSASKRTSTSKRPACNGRHACVLQFTIVGCISIASRVHVKARFGDPGPQTRSRGALYCARPVPSNLKHCVTAKVVFEDLWRRFLLRAGCALVHCYRRVYEF